MGKFATILLVLLPLLFCFAACPIHAQYECSVKHFNTNNGFPDNEVTALAMDYDGYLWIGTYTCLVRYDGTHFKTFFLDKDKASLRNTIMYAMPLPADKKLMIKTRSLPVHIISKGKPILYSDSDFPNGSVWTFIRGNFPTSSLFEKFYKQVFGFFPYTDNLHILPLNNKDFIAANGGPGQFIYFKDGKKHSTYVIKEHLKMFLVSKNRRYLLDAQNRLFLYDSASNQFNIVNLDWKSIKKKGKNTNEAVFFSDSHSGESFCWYNLTLYMLDFGAQQNQVVFIPQFSMPDNKHFWSSVLYDSLHASFFLSTQNEGFFQVKLKKIKNFNVSDRLPKNIDQGMAINYSVVKTSDSTAVIPAGFQFTARDSGIGIKKLGNIFGNRETIGMLNDGSIMVSWLNYFSPKDGYRMEHVFNDSFARYNKLQIQLVYPEGDSVWVSTNNAVFLVTKQTMQVLFDKVRDKADSNHCELHLFYRTGKDEALVSNIHGLFRLHTVPPYEMFAIPALRNQLVHSISAYKNVLILSVYKYGLYILKDGRVYKMPVPGYPEGIDQCNAIYTDKSGYLWLTTDKGLFKSLASSAVESALNQGVTTPLFFYYGNENGIENTQFTGSGVPPYAALKGERLLFPSLGGMVSFRPQDLADKIVSTPVLIEQIIIDNKDTTGRNDSIRLDADFKYLVIDLNVPHFSDSKNLLIEYNPDNTEWKKLAAIDKLQITLSDISSGNHQLIIRKRTGFGNADYAYTRLTIYKEKSIYEKFWFYLLLLLALILLVWVASKIQTRNINQKRKLLQKKVNEQTAELSKAGEVKDLLISIISHDMVSPLRYIATIAKVLKKGLEKDPRKAELALENIQTTSERILSGSISIINWMKYNNKKIEPDKKTIQLAAMADELMQVYIPIAADKNISLVNDVPRTVFVKADHNILSTILTNIISNAVKYTDEGTVSIFAEETNTGTTTILYVSDTGRGMSEEKLISVKEVLAGNLLATHSTENSGTGLGYIMIAELLKVHHLTASIESDPGKGTTVSIMINTSPQ